VGVHNELLYTVDLTWRHPNKNASQLHLPTTMRENWKPLFTDFLNTWLGRLAKPTKVADAFSCMCMR